MRLICPNCDAQYEVDDSVIPKDGRDVQCSSCGQTWFQKSAAQLEAEGESPEEAEVIPAEQDAAPGIETEAEVEAEQEAAVESEPELEPESDPESELEPEFEPESEAEPEPEPEPEAEPEPEPEPEQQKPDDAVLDILREEAERETEARLNEAQGGLETQPDLGLDQSDEGSNTHAAAISERTARLRGIEPAIDKSGSRSDMLPDIEEINSTLRAASGDEDSETEVTEVEKKRGKRGFRLGFAFVLILATFLLLAYAYAPQIIEKIPASESFMNGYVEKVDSLRLWLDQMMKTATDKMSGDGAVAS